MGPRASLVSGNVRIMIEIVRVAPDGWRLWRELRLAALTAWTPVAPRTSRTRAGGAGK